MSILLKVAVLVALVVSGVHLLLLLEELVVKVVFDILLAIVLVLVAGLSLNFGSL